MMSGAYTGEIGALRRAAGIRPCVRTRRGGGGSPVKSTSTEEVMAAKSTRRAVAMLGRSLCAVGAAGARRQRTGCRNAERRVNLFTSRYPNSAV